MIEIRLAILIFGCSVISGCGGVPTPQRNEPPPIIAVTNTVDASTPATPAPPPGDAGTTPPSFEITPGPAGVFAGAAHNVPQAGLGAIWASNDDVFLSSANSVYRSSDRGLHFVEVTKELTYYTSGAMWGSSASDVYIGGDGIVFHSIDGGVTFSRAAPVPAFLVLAIWGSGADEVFIGGAGDASATDAHPLLARSTDHGKSWVRITTPVVDGSFSAITTTDGKDLVVSGSEVAKPPSVKKKLAPVIIRSLDRGKTWSRIPTFPQTSPYEAARHLCFTSGALFATSTNQLYVTRDWGKSWKQIKHANGVLGQFACHGTDLVIGGSEGRLFVSRDLGATWDDAPFKAFFPADEYPSVGAIAITEAGETYIGLSERDRRASLFRRSH